MFAVFANTMGEEEVSGCGFTPQAAWDKMLSDFHIDENDDIDMDSVVFYRQTEVYRQTKFVWVESE